MTEALASLLYSEPTILMTFTTHTISTMQLLRAWSSFHNYTNLERQRFTLNDSILAECMSDKE